MVNPGNGTSRGLTCRFLKTILSATCAKMFAPTWALIHIGQCSHKIHVCVPRKQHLMLILHGVAAEHATFNNIPPVYYLLLLYKFLHTDIFFVSFYNYEKYKCSRS